MEAFGVVAAAGKSEAVFGAAGSVVTTGSVGSGLTAGAGGEAGCVDFLALFFPDLAAFRGCFAAGWVDLALADWVRLHGDLRSSSGILDTT